MAGEHCMGESNNAECECPVCEEQLATLEEANARGRQP
jgi:hypothetical protein